MAIYLVILILKFIKIPYTTNIKYYLSLQIAYSKLTLTSKIINFYQQ